MKYPSARALLLQRLQGFNAINGSELASALESNLTYYQVNPPIELQREWQFVNSSFIIVQLWNSSQWILNDGPQGLQRLDYVVATAEKYDIRLIVTLTNNWYVHTCIRVKGVFLTATFQGRLRSKDQNDTSLSNAS